VRAVDVVTDSPTYRGLADILSQNLRADGFAMSTVDATAVNSRPPSP
jgi:hypothetical protein